MEDMTEDNTHSLSQSMPMSLVDFQQEITSYLNLLEKSFIEMSNIHQIFEKENHIWPDQYRNLSDLLDN